MLPAMPSKERPDSIFTKRWPDSVPDSMEEHLSTITLVNIPHPQIPNLFQRCYEYVEPWQWSPEVELVETGQWFYGSAQEVGNFF